MLHIIHPTSEEFEKLYLKVREQEGRLYDVEAVRQLPSVEKTDIHASEWKVREAGMKAFLNYLEEREDVQRILELGCGNGWFSAAVAQRYPELQVVGCDMNLYELRIAEKAFNEDNLNFLFANIFDEWPPEWQEFDLVIIPSSVQYFEDLAGLFKRLWQFAPEIHILDSPFYKDDELIAAMQRSKQYYHQLGFPKMARSYFHHSFNELNKFGPQYIYRPPQGWRRKFARSPFPWVRLLKPEA